MKIALIIALIAGAVVFVGSKTSLSSKITSKLPISSITSKLKAKPVESEKKPEATSSSKSAVAANPKGSVKGLMTNAENVGKSVFTASIAMGKSAANILTQKPSKPEETIDVSKTVSEIAGKVDDIPSTILSQAKVEYCKQVLIDATRSASPKP